jgi:uncharacterized protein (TIGR00288 family)
MDNSENNSSVAVFIDVENIHYSTLNSYAETPDWSRIVDQCKLYGRIASIQAFGDWIEFSKEVIDIQRNGIQPIFVPLSQDGKSSLDCYLIVSAMKLFFQNDAIDTLILGSGDRDYIPLINELKALGKKVIILAVPDTLSKDLTKIVDGVISYESTSNGSTIPTVETSTSELEEVQSFVIRTVKELEEKSIDHRWVNMAKVGASLHRKDPSFTHKKYKYAKLVEMLDDIPQVELKYDNHEKTIALARTVSVDRLVETPKVIQGSIFNIKDGYGFITPEQGQDNLFFHFSKLLCGIDDLAVGDNVSYTTYNTNRGLNAENIERIV